jgi:hypothetical protein
MIVVGYSISAFKSDIEVHSTILNHSRTDALILT